MMIWVSVCSTKRSEVFFVFLHLEFYLVFYPNHKVLLPELHIVLGLWVLLLHIGDNVMLSDII